MDIQLKDASNPVGAVIADEGIDNFITVMSSVWDSEKEDVPWYKPWKRISFTRVTDFLMKSLDDLIAYVDDYVDANGADKKATVLDAISRLYDYVVVEAMPIFLKPFAGSIKNYIINDLISTAIDWIVDKYRNGEWRKKDSAELKALWAAEVAALSAVPGGMLPN